jgi:autophagy-related protein 9
MARNIFSRFGPTNNDELPWYEQVRDEQNPDEHRLGLALDEENLTHNFHDDDLERAPALALDDSRISTTSPVAAARDPPRGNPTVTRQDAPPRWLSSQEDEGDNDVPASLLVEGPSMSTAPSRANPRRSGRQPTRHTAVPGPSNRRAQTQWETAQAHQRLHADEELDVPGADRLQAARKRPGFAGSPRDKAMFRWANVSNLDVFIRDVYDYYLGGGIWCILLERFLHLL